MTVQLSTEEISRLLRCVEFQRQALTRFPQQADATRSLLLELARVEVKLREAQAGPGGSA